MTLLAVFVALAVFTGYLLLEDWHWQRKHRPPTVARGPLPGRCLCCDPPVHVDDIFTHSRLAHGRRVVAPEDSSEWAS